MDLEQQIMQFGLRFHIWICCKVAAFVGIIAKAAFPAKIAALQVFAHN